MTRTRPTDRLSASGRARVVAWIVGVSAVGLLVMLVALVVALRWTVTDGIQDSINQERDEIAAFAETGVDPETGQPFNTPERFVELFLDRQRAEPTELLFGGTAGTPVIGQLSGAAAVPVEALAPATREALSVPRSNGSVVDPAHGRISWSNVGITTPEASGFVVMAVLHEHYDQRVTSQAILLSLLALASLAATTAVAWILAGRILGHTAEFDAAVRASLRGGGLARLPENGSDEYAGLARGANELVRRSDRLVNRERRFTDDVTFALRTPLTVMEAGLRHPAGTEEDRRATLHHVAEEATRVRGLVDDLVILSRLQQEDLVLDPRPVDVGTLVTTGAQAWHERLGDDDGLLLDLHASEEALVAVTDAGRLVQVLEEALDNARHAVLHAAGSDRPRDLAALSPLERTLSVHVHREEREGGPFAVVEVVDRGRGVPDEEREEVFERLAGASNDPYPGNGLGLPVASLLMRALGGGYELESSGPGDGARVRLWVPLAEEAEGEQG